MSSDELSSIERLSILTRLVLKFESNIRTLEAVRYAKDLAAVIDEMKLFNVDLSLLQQEFTSYFSEHWKRRTNFLSIVTNFWPKILNELNKEDVKFLGTRRQYLGPFASKNPELELKTLDKIIIYEADDIFHELEFITSTVLQNKCKKVIIVSPDKDTSTLLRFKFNAEISEKTKITEKTILDKVEKYFGDMPLENNNEFGKIIDELLMPNAPGSKSELSDNVTLVDDVSIVDKITFDVSICASMNEASWYPAICGEYWLHQSIRQKIGIPTKSVLKQQMENDFYNLISASGKVFLTRPKKINKSDTRKSPILAKLEMRCRKTKLFINYCKKDWKCNSASKTVNSTSRISNFIIPNRLSTGSLGLLMQNPYDFYARYSLELESTDVNRKSLKKTNIFRDLIKNYFCNKDCLDHHLKLIKQTDFFYYQQCLNMIDWMQSYFQKPYGFCNIMGCTNLGDSGTELYGSIDIAEAHHDYTLISHFQAFSPPATRELLYGTDCAILATCLIAEKNGFQEIRVPIREIRIYWPALKNKSSPFSVKILEISGNLIRDFEDRVCNLLNRFSSGYERDDRDIGKQSSYWHLERREK
ncbi:MAG: hypothetical protein LBL32_02855 [Holosporales bacterium]|jgi:hypothetical protein|nr:hypothetical protein [Holosporales bacterium]